MKAWGAAHPGLFFALGSAVWLLVLYGRVLGAPFVYDDLDQVVNNPGLRSVHAAWVQFGLAPVTFTGHFRGVGGAFYRPLFWLSLLVDQAAWGASAAGFHFTNLFLAWADGCLLVLLLRWMRVGAWVAAAAGWIWLTLPINTEVIAWVSGRTYSLCGLFLLMGALAVARYLRDGRWTAVVGFGAAGVAALLSHEAGVLMLPVILLVWLASVRDARRLGVLVGVTAACDAGWLGLRLAMHVSGGQGAGSIAGVGAAFWRYVGWMVLPVRMSVERSSEGVAPVWAQVAGWVGLMGVAAGAWWLRRSRPGVAGGLGWLVVATLPFCGAVFLYQGMAERYGFLGSAGLAVAVAAAVGETSGVGRRVGVGVVAVWMLWCVWRTEVRVGDWVDPVALYRHSLEATPGSATLWYDLGSVLGSVLGETQEAVGAYRESLKLRPGDATTMTNLGAALEEQGDKAGAEGMFRRAIAAEPGQEKAYNDLGELLFGEGRAGEAEEVLLEAVRIAPGDATPLFNLGVLYQSGGRDELAQGMYGRVLVLRPGDADTVANMGRLRLR